MQTTDASLVLFDDELSPTQGKNIEDAIGKRVMDRAELILDIFATRARTSEAKMQVELAQLEYMLPRLTRMWTHLEKFRGGIGMRGPGETQLETDRRLINHRIKILQRAAAATCSRAARSSASRGRTSSRRRSSATRTPASRRSCARCRARRRCSSRTACSRRSIRSRATSSSATDAHVLLTDTVGFIRKLPHHLVASFRATLEETREADLLLHVIDAGSPAWEEQRMVVDQVLDELGVNDQPKLLVFNKIDLLEHDALLALQERIAALVPSSVFVSTVTDGGLEPLRRALTSAIRVRAPADADSALAVERQAARGDSSRSRGRRSAHGGRPAARGSADRRGARRPAATCGRAGQQRKDAHAGLSAEEKPSRGDEARAAYRGCTGREPRARENTSTSSRAHACRITRSDTSNASRLLEWLAPARPKKSRPGCWPTKWSRQDLNL